MQEPEVSINDLLPKSRTEKKTAMSVVEDLAKKVLDLSQGEFQDLDVEPALRRDIITARELKSHIARRRQLRFIVKRIAETGFDELNFAFERVKHGKGASAQRFRLLEDWREQLITGDASALDTVLEALPNCDRKQLEKLQRAAQRERASAQPPLGAKALFRYLRQTSEEGLPKI